MWGAKAGLLTDGVHAVQNMFSYAIAHCLCFKRWRRRWPNALTQLSSDIYGNWDELCGDEEDQETKTASIHRHIQHDRNIAKLLGVKSKRKALFPLSPRYGQVMVLFQWFQTSFDVLTRRWLTCEQLRVPISFWMSETSGNANIWFVPPWFRTNFRRRWSSNQINVDKHVCLGKQQILPVVRPRRLMMTCYIAF